MATQAPAAASPLLSMTGISKRFAATQALKDVSLEVRRGEVLALIGENGAGKSTLMKILSGAQRADEGTMQLDGVAYQPSGPHAARLAGVAMIYQELNLAPHLSVEDNIMLGIERHSVGWVRRSVQRREVREALARLGHADLPLDMPVARLSVAMQQLVEIARALVGRPRVVVFDEPTSSLTQSDTRRLFDVIRRLKADGLGIIYISHFLEEVREIGDRYTVLRDGSLAGSGSLADVTEEQIVSLMVGRSVQELFPQVPHEPGEVILTVDQLQGRRTPRDVSLELRRGEILGIAGLVGAGRTEFLRTLFGLDAVRAGRVRVAGLVPRGTPAGMIAAGLGLVSEDRKGEGLAQSRSIEDNITYSRLKPYSTFGWLNLRHRRQAVKESMAALQIKAASPAQSVQQLSGGNQQKVAIARVLHQQADIILLDEPTRGIDVGTKAEIYRLMGQAAAAGKAVIFVSSYLPELMAVCDHIGVMARGVLHDVRPTEAWTAESIMACAVS